MTLSRRDFLFRTGVVAGTLCAGLRVDARGLLTDPLLDAVVQRALDAAKKAGASYADIRIVRRRWESVTTRDDHIQSVGSNDNYGLGIRVICQGAWGFAACSRVIPEEADRVARVAVDIAKANSALVKQPVTLAPNPVHVDVWQTPLIKNPFKISVADKAELLLAINQEALKVSGVKFVSSQYNGVGEWKLYANSEGAYLEQDITRLAPAYSVTAVNSATGEFEERGHGISAMQAGWEYVEESSMLADARKVAEDAVEKLKSPGVVAGKKDLILSPENLWLTIHESVGHPTELDRALGYEANFAGTSFVTVDKLNKLEYAAPHVTLYADKTTPGGLATSGYDDDGVKTQKWDIVKNGKFVAYQTTRDQAAWIGEKTSRGTCYAQDHRSFPFQRMPNLSLQPGEKDLGVKDLIAATDDGIYVVGHGSYSIDHQRYNFQFGGQMFYEVKNGKITHALKDVAYQSNTLEFWRSCDLIGGAREWKLGGSMFDGKGEPPQLQAVSHGCPPTRFKQVNILNTNMRKRGTP